jgi:hypothetical protein
MVDLDGCDKRFEEDSFYWQADDSDPEFDFDDEDLEISGYFDLSSDEVFAAQEALCRGLGGPVAAMWWVNGLPPDDIIRSRLLRFPLDKALAAGRLIWSLPEDSRWPVVQTVYVLYRFARLRDDDYRRLDDRRT